MMLGSARKQSAANDNESSSDTSASTECSNKLSEIDSDADPCPGESWVQWIVRTTRCVESCLRKARLADWVEEHYRRLWRFSGHTARRTDGRWSTEFLHWQPHMGCRAPWRPTKRWGDSLDNFFGHDETYQKGGWIEVAQEHEKWTSLEERFVKAMT